VDGDGERIEVSLCTLKLIEKEIIETGEIDRSESHPLHAFNALSGAMIRMCIGDGATKDQIIGELKISPTIVDWLINFWCAVDLGMQEQHRPLYKSFRAADGFMVDIFIGHGKWASVEKGSIGD
jgi:hypothetical protein